MLGTPGGAVFSTCGSVSNTVSPAITDVATGITTAAKTNSCGYTWYRRDEQVIWYDSPNWNGFTFGAVLQTNYAKQETSTGSINPSMWQLGAKYVGTSLPLEAWGAYGRRKDQFGLLAIGVADEISGVLGSNAISAQSSSDTAWQLGAAYTLGDIKIFALYESLKWKLDTIQLSDALTGNVLAQLGNLSLKRDAWAAGLKWNLASGYVGAQFIQAMKWKGETDGISTDIYDTGAYMLGLGYYHTMSKQTQVYVVGSYIDNKDFANYGTAGISNSAQFKNPGVAVWGLGVGIKHSF
jgi:predicted porin